ncbi:MAG: CZB domain-containing protein, partial [Candidatus Kapabacteria bacterium]|nr:CZB domain-containing protein [Candidatus Kapabacteria bacterium]
SHKDCDLGKWMYSEGLEKYSQYPDMKKLEMIHSDLHKVIKNVVNWKLVGDISAAENELTKMNTISSEIVGLLDNLSKV